MYPSGTLSHEEILVRTCPKNGVGDIHRENRFNSFTDIPVLIVTFNKHVIQLHCELLTLVVKFILKLSSTITTIYPSFIPIFPLLTLP